MTNNSVITCKYSKIEKENGSSIKCRASSSHTRGSKKDTTQYFGSKSNTDCCH